MSPESLLASYSKAAIESLYGSEIDSNLIQVQRTNREFEGDFTLVVFPLLRVSRRKPEETGRDIGEYLVRSHSEVASYNVVKGFLNISLSDGFWCGVLNTISHMERYGFEPAESSGRTVMVEYSSPNTNKPLHLGHIRNNLLGFSVARLMEAAGHKVIKVNLVNDRGIHICKSMLAWQMFGNGETPAVTGRKGDHLVGDYYVRFDKEYKQQVAKLTAEGVGEAEAKAKVPIIMEAQEMLRRWEAKDVDVYTLWETMNGWVYQGFDVTYRKLGVEFDRIYYESQTYLLGKVLVNEGLEKGVFFKRPDGSVWVDLTPDGLDEKLLLRSDGTSVYITQDIGTALQRFSEYELNDHIYVVGNEQEYHFQVLKLVLRRLGYQWADHIFHLSYGMVQLPEGKMKSREGTVVDADDLIDEMVSTARSMANELGKLDGLTELEAEEVFTTVGMGALKYFILRVDPKKSMTFNPRESIDFNGNTGPFIQYTHARICSVLRKAQDAGVVTPSSISIGSLGAKEKELVKALSQYPAVVALAAQAFSPALVANFAYELAKEYNQFYHDHPIAKESDGHVRSTRLLISKLVADAIRSSMWLLGIDVPERM